MTTFIRPATLDDEAAISHICLVTGEAGQSAEGIYTKPELLSIVWATPYLHAKNAFAYVLVTTVPKEEGERVIGYIIGTTNSPALSEELARDWWPAWATKYPVETTPGNERDKGLMQLLVEPLTYPDYIAERVRAKAHINILPEARGGGWGRRLMNKAVQEAKKAGCTGLYLRLDPRNDKGRQFYKHIGFKPTPAPKGENYILSFEDFVPPAKE